MEKTRTNEAALDAAQGRGGLHVVDGPGVSAAQRRALNVNHEQLARVEAHMRELAHGAVPAVLRHGTDHGSHGPVHAHH